MTDREVMQQALEALNSDHPDIQLRAAIALQIALKTEHEPVNGRERNPNHQGWVEPLYAAPVKQWVGLTLREVEKCIYDANDDPIVVCRNVEAKLKEHNT